MRIELRAGCRGEPGAAEVLRSHLALVLGRFAARLHRVEIRLRRVAGEGRWRCDVTFDDGSTLVVEDPVASPRAGAMEHLAGRVARAVALRVAREYVR